MLDLLLLGAGAVLAPGVRLVLVRLRRGRWWEPPLPNRHLPPPAGHQAVVRAGERTMECPCGWRYTVPWPLTSGRLNGARLHHYAAVEQERLARRLGVDAESMLDRLPTAQGAARQPQQAARPELGLALPQVEAGSRWPRRLEPTRIPRRAFEARRSSAIARVESGRVLPKYTGGDG